MNPHEQQASNSPLSRVDVELMMEKSSSVKKDKSESKEERKQKAAYIWGQSTPDHESIQRYLTSRNIHLEEIPEALRWNDYKGAKKVVAAVTKPEEETVGAIHQTWINDDFHREKKGMLAPCKGRAVWLSEPAEKMLIGEGIETTLAAMAASGLPGVSGLDAGKMQAIDLPQTVKEIIILVDCDHPGKAGQNAAKSLAARLEAEGRKWKSKAVKIQ
jgi:DNA primase